MNIGTQRAASFVSQSRATGSVFEIVVLIIVIALSYHYLLGPKLAEYRSRSTELTKVNTQAALLEKQTQTFSSLVSQMETKRDAIALLDEAVPLDGKISKIYVLVEDLAQRAGLSAASISVDTASAGISAGQKAVLQNPFGVEHMLAKLPVTVNATGTMQQLKNFLEGLETSGRILDVTNVDVTQGKGDQLIFKVNAQAYAYTPDNTGKKSPAGSQPTGSAQGE